MTGEADAINLAQGVPSLAILLWATGPERPDLCAAPFIYASAAAALDIAVEIHFAAGSVGLLVPAFAETLFASRDRLRPISAFMHDAHAHGARFLACSAALHERGLRRESLIPEVDAIAGATSFIVRSLDPGWRTLVF